MDKYLSKERLEELRVEVEDLKTKKRREIAERLKNAKEFGDLSENSEYTEAREEQAQVESRIFELEEILRQAVVIEKTKAQGMVQVGSRVILKKGSQTLTYVIVGSNETSPEEGRISNESPLGAALLSHRVGDQVKVRTPDGEAAFEITAIE